MGEMERCTCLNSRASVSQCKFSVSQPKLGYDYTFFPGVLPANQVVKHTIMCIIECWLGWVACHFS